MEPPSAAHVTPRQAPGFCWRWISGAGCLRAKPQFSGPTYSRACAGPPPLAGRQVRGSSRYRAASPRRSGRHHQSNNPDGRVIAKTGCLRWRRFENRGGSSSWTRRSWMSAPRGQPRRRSRPSATSSCCGRSADSSASRGCGWVSRSPHHIAAALNASLGPWAVSGLCARGWRARAARTARGWMPHGTGWRTRRGRSIGCWRKRTLTVVGGTSLFRLAQVNLAADTFKRLGHAGIVVRVFPRTTNLAAVWASKRPGLELPAVATRDRSVSEVHRRPRHCSFVKSA